MKYSVLLAVLTFASLQWSGSEPIGQPPGKLAGEAEGRATLGVPLIAQQARWWCWAASTEMVMRYFQGSVDRVAPVSTQCEQAKQYYIWNIRNSINLWPDSNRLLADTSLLDCSAQKIAEQFDLKGIPFTPGMPYYDTTQTSVLAWDSLLDRVMHNRPVIFQWNAAGISNPNETGSHVMVAEGCSVMPSVREYQWVAVNDPYPLDAVDPVGRHTQMAYSDYCNTTRTTIRWNKKFVWSSSGTSWTVTKHAH